MAAKKHKKIIIIRGLEVMKKTFSLLCILFLITAMDMSCKQRRQCINEVNSNSSSAQKTKALTLCSKLMKIEFPPSTRLIYYGEGDDSYGYSMKKGVREPLVASLKIEISKDDLRSFEEQIKSMKDATPNFGDPLRSRDYKNYLSVGYEPIKLWTPHLSKNHKTGQVSLKPPYSSPILDIHVDLDHSDEIIIYLVYHNRS